jgi:hypothetical protein
MTSFIGSRENENLGFFAHGKILMTEGKGEQGKEIHCGWMEREGGGIAELDSVEGEGGGKRGKVVGGEELQGGEC